MSLTKDNMLDRMMSEQENDAVIEIHRLKTIVKRLEGHIDMYKIEVDNHIKRHDNLLNMIQTAMTQHAQLQDEHDHTIYLYNKHNSEYNELIETMNFATSCQVPDIDEVSFN